VFRRQSDRPAAQNAERSYYRKHYNDTSIPTTTERPLSDVRAAVRVSVEKTTWRAIPARSTAMNQTLSNVFTVASKFDRDTSTSIGRVRNV
jgi:hypothetical protein